MRRELVKEFVGRGHDAKEVAGLFGSIEKQLVRRNILDKNLRPDHRGLAEIRPVTAEVGILPRVHGSSLFTRGETQAIVAVTLSWYVVVAALIVFAATTIRWIADVRRDIADLPLEHHH